MIIFTQQPSKVSTISLFINNFISMSRSSKQQKTIPANKASAQSLQVEKVVNQRYTNGKKEYKVIWSGRPFEQATWVPQEKINSAQVKINEFLKRYQEVIKRKNLIMKNTAQNSSQSPLQKIQPISKPEGKKISLEKPQNGTQQKLVLNQSSNLNKEKLQASLAKNNIIKSQSIKIDSDPYQVQRQSQLVSFQDSSSEKIPNEKFQKDPEIKSKQVNGTDSNKFNASKTRKFEYLPEQQEDTAETTEICQMQIPQQQTFINFTERLEIEKICGILTQELPSRQNDQSSAGKNIKMEKEAAPYFFLVKSKFQAGQKIVSRQRIVNEQPLKLIEFYEDLLMESQQQGL